MLKYGITQIIHIKQDVQVQVYQQLERVRVSHINRTESKYNSQYIWNNDIWRAHQTVAAYVDNGMGLSSSGQSILDADLK